MVGKGACDLQWECLAVLKALLLAAVVLRLLSVGFRIGTADSCHVEAEAKQRPEEQKANEKRKIDVQRGHQPRVLLPTLHVSTKCCKMNLFLHSAKKGQGKGKIKETANSVVKKLRKYRAFCSKKLRNSAKTCFLNFQQEQSGAFLIFSCCARLKSMRLAHAQSEEQQQWVWKLSCLSIILTWFNSRTQHSSHESITPCNSSI